MAISRSAMRDKVKVVTVDWEDESLEVGIRPGRYTGDLMEALLTAKGDAERLAAAEDEDGARAAVERVATLTAEVIAWWDVLDDDGNRLPVDGDTMNSLPLAFVQHVMTSAGEAIRPPTSRG